MKYFKAACLISKVDWSTSELAKIKDLLKELKTKEIQIDFFNYCLKWKLAPICYTHLRKYHLLDNLNENVRQSFEQEYNKIADQNKRRNIQAVKILEAMLAHNIDVVILKGNYLAHEVYQEVGYKRMNDFDILINKQDWDKIQSIYLEMGYIPLGFGWSGEKEKPAKFSHVGMSFISPDYSCIIGSQWGLKSPTTHYNVDINEAWEIAESFNFCGIPAKALSTEYNLLHLILHMGTHKCGIRDCMDIYNMARSKTVDLEKFSRLIQKSGATNKANFTLSISNYCSQEFSNEFIQSLKENASGYYKRRLKRRTTAHLKSGDFQTSYTDYFQEIEKEVIHLNLYPKFHKKLRYYFKILRLIYFSKSSISLKLNDKFYAPTLANKIVSRLRAPYYVFALIAQEIGWKFTFLLFLKLNFDLLFSIKNYFIRKESYFDYLEKKGVNPSDIKKVIDGIQ